VLGEVHADASQFKIIIPTGIMGQRIEGLLQEGQREEAIIAFLALNSASVAVNNPFRTILNVGRATTAVHPFLRGLRDVDMARVARDEVLSAIGTLNTDREKFVKWLHEKEEEIDRVANRYMKGLPIEKPAVHWRRAARRNYRLMYGFLILFAISVFGPAAIVWAYWPIIQPNIENLFARSTGIVPFGALTVLLVPAIAYGWLLKHISRLFIQSYALAVDAEHRGSLAVTYLGLVDYEKANLAEAERAIILNALFRPPPPYSGDEGPPAGLLDLIRKQ
jgi:hypothetical protein